MACSPSDNSIDVTPSPLPPLPGLGSPFAPIQIPLPDLDLPTDLLEDLLALMEQLGALFPSGLFKANPDFGMKNVLDFIANIMSQLAPFLSFYNFIMALLNLIICIIEVLCCIPDIFCVAIKLKKLFSECLPPFVQMFPWLALIAMILALLLLILALILYILETILAIILQIIENILLFEEAIRTQDTDATLAAAQKIASLLCFIENLMALFVAIAAILAIIQALAAFGGSGICDDEDNEGCCDPAICPPFLKENKEIDVTNGTFVYHSRVGLEFPSIPGIPAELAEAISASLAPLRTERWELFDADAGQDIPISLIITPTQLVIGPLVFASRIYYPEQEFNEDASLSQAPYTVDMRMLIDPGVFHPTDTGGARFMRINDCIVVRKPYVGVIEFNSPTIFGLTIPTGPGGTGTFNLEGGKVFEDDGETPFEVEAIVGSLTVTTQANLNEFIFIDPITSPVLPVVDDGYTITEVEFTWKPNHPALAGHRLITAGCVPEVNLEKAAFNTVLLAELGADAGDVDVGSVLSRVPDVANLADNVIAAQQCVLDAVAKYRTSISVETSATFQAEVESCMNNLTQQVTDVYCAAFLDYVSVFNSTFSLDTNLQFTSRAITVSIVLRDASGTEIAGNIPEDCLDDIIDKLRVNATFGEVSDITYDRDNALFIAQITSEDSGTGTVTLTFDGETFSVLVESTVFDVPSSIVETVVAYEFVDAASQPGVRRDATDTSGDSS